MRCLVASSNSSLGDGVGDLPASDGHGTPGGLGGGEPLLQVLGVEDQGLHDVVVGLDLILAESAHLGDLADDDLLEGGVPVLTSHQPLSVGGDGGEALAVDLEDGDVEGPSSEVVDQDLLGSALVVAESEADGGRGGLVEEGDLLQSRDPARVDGGLPLLLSEVGGDGDDRALDGALVQSVVLLEVLQELAEDESGEGGRGVPDAVDVDGVVGSHLPLDVQDEPVAGVHQEHVLGGGTHQLLAHVVEQDDGRGGVLVFVVPLHDGFVVVVDVCEARVGGSQIDAYAEFFAHCSPFFTVMATV